jgi:hypothetical protein
LALAEQDYRVLHNQQEAQAVPVVQTEAVPVVIQVAQAHQDRVAVEVAGVEYMQAQHIMLLQVAALVAVVVLKVHQMT